MKDIGETDVILGIRIKCESNSLRITQSYYIEKNIKKFDSEGGDAISWAYKKQTCITDSIMESEFIALAAARKEAEWLMNLICDIPLCPKPISHIFIHCDSVATLGFVCSQQNLEDHLTKGLARYLVYKSAIGM
ncbi:hypothetical protein Tco_0377396 [Tanacetum coccineum]